MQKTELLAVGLIIGILGVISGFLILSARSQLRDVTRIAHMREMQIGLDLYFLETGSYPAAGENGAALALGQASTACLSKEGFGAPCAADAAEVPYIEFVPAAPSQGLNERSQCGSSKNAYCYTTDSEGFRVQFELESGNRQVGLQKGLNCLTENGFVAGACPAFPEGEEESEGATP